MSARNAGWIRRLDKRVMIGAGIVVIAALIWVGVTRDNESENVPARLARTRRWLECREFRCKVR